MPKKNNRPTIAARKKVQEQKQAEQLAKRRAFYQKYRKQLIAGAVIAIAAVLVLALAIDYFYVPAGSLRTFLGRTLEGSENALIRKVNGRYYELGSLSTPEGYAPADYGRQMLADDNETFLYFVAEDDAQAVASVYATGVKSKTGTEMLEAMATSGLYREMSDIRTAQIAGHDVCYRYTRNTFTDSATGAIESYYAMLILYADTIKDSTVLINCTSATFATEEELPSEEAMAAELEPILSALQLP